MTGPLTHFMPVLKPHRPFPGDPYFNYISFLSEWRGRVDDTFAEATVDMNIPRDKSPNHLPLSISGTPNRYPMVTANSLTPAPFGVSDIAAYQFDQNNNVGSAIVIHDGGALDLADNNFDIYVKFRTQSTEAWSICGRYMDGGYSWRIEYYKALKKMRFTVSVDGTTINASYGHCEFRMGTIDDGVTVAEMANNQWHEINVIRLDSVIILYFDGFPGNKPIIMEDLASMSIYDPPSDTYLTHIGSITGHPSTIDTSNGNFEGQIKHFKMTIDGSVAVDVDFSEYWGMWWVGNYPQTLWPTSNNLIQETFQDELGLKKHVTYVGNKFPYNQHLNLVDQDFTIELFDVKINYTEDEVQVVAGFGWPTYKSWRILTKNVTGASPPGHLVFQYSLNNIAVIELTFIEDLTSGTVIEANLTVCRKGNTIRLYMDGQMVASGSISGSLFNGSTNLIPLSFFGNMVNGDNAMDDARILAVRITKGIGRYSGPFYRVPTLPLPKSTT
jgi:hypothetical protein